MLCFPIKLAAGFAANDSFEGVTDVGDDVGREVGEVVPG